MVKYLSGLLDADGVLGFGFNESRDGSKSNLFLQMKLSASSVVDKQSFVASLPSLTGLGFIHRFKGDLGQDFVAWHVTKGSDLEKLLPRVIKHMVIKARHWQWLLDTLRERRRRPLGERSISHEEREQLREASKASRHTNAGPIKAKNHPSWAWLAGYLDGDGCYSMDPVKRPCRYVLRVYACAHVNDASVLAFIQKALGGTVANHSQSPNVMIWYRNLGKADRSFALRVLPKVAKHSRLKRYKIDRMIAYHTTNND